MRGSPTAAALIFRAAARYACSSAGELPCASATLSKPKADTSGGSSEATSTSSASRSRIALAYSARLSRRRTGRPGRARAGAIQLVLEPRDQTVSGRLIGPAHAVRRHGADAQLADNLLPGLGVRLDVRDVERVERESACLQPLVVTGDAVPLDRGLMRDRRTLRRYRGRRGHTWRRASRTSDSSERDLSHCANLRSSHS